MVIVLAIAPLHRAQGRRGFGRPVSGRSRLNWRGSETIGAHSPYLLRQKAEIQLPEGFEAPQSIVLPGVDPKPR